ncbi:carbohydrate-binding protein [Flavitalea sp.]|nr:carbohydrate-binding protein [Flavitalea sp.]
MKFNVILLLVNFIAGCAPSFNPDESYKKKMQEIPGRVECEYFDTGGEGVAYHDMDSVNNGSGKLNPVNGNLLNEFRIHEGVDISYTKTRLIDNNPYNKVAPDSNQLYVGWTMPGEWINYTVHVNQAAFYRVGMMYTANGDGIISLDLDGQSVAGHLVVPSTNDVKDTIDWRQWHHWNKVDSLTTIKMERGTHKLKVHIVEHGQMNLDFFEFTNTGKIED